MTKEEYNKVPLMYCQKCLSIKVKEEEGYSICGDCGNDTFEEDVINDWEYRFKLRYGVSYLEWK